MKTLRLMLTVACMSLGALAMAHTHLEKSVPADGSSLREAPPKFVLTFAKPARLTALSLQKDAEPARKLTPLPPAASSEISIPAPPLTAGHYTLSWRAMSDDGHVMPGKITFTITATGASN